MEQIAPRYRYPYFSHIFDGGYSSGYYSYLWAEVLDKDAYQAFVESGDLFDRATAKRLRTLLAAGGTKDGMDLYRDFRGAEPKREPLMIARGLVTPEELNAEKEGEEVKTEIKPTNIVGSKPAQKPSAPKRMRKDSPRNPLVHSEK